MKRPDALKFATHLQTYIAGASLPSNLSYLALVEPAVLHALQSWISETEDSRTLIGCVYSLISQLLQFSIEETDLDLSPERLAKLDGSMESWDTSLDLLEGLLECTPLLPYCVIYGLNDLDWAAGAEACAEVFDVLLRHRERADSVFNILLTIAGRSKTLARCISAEQRLYASDEIRRVERRGKRLDLVAPEALASPHVSPRISPERWL